MKSRNRNVIRALLLIACSYSTVSSAASVSGQGTWATTLQGRDLDGNAATFEAYYDTALNITWLADANAAVGSVYDTHLAGTGVMNWADANLWAAGLNINGVTGWRLPDTVDIGNDGCTFSLTGGTGNTDCGYNMNTSSGEMASMFYDTLGNLALYDSNGIQRTTGWGLTNTGPFSNVQSSSYWSATGYVTDTTRAWHFLTDSGNQFNNLKTNNYYAWAVHSGDVSAVPVPAAMWLFGSGLIGLIGVAKRKARI